MHQGEVVDGRFLLLARHGAGGMGELYRARDLSTGDVVAVKTLHVGDPDRFAREAATLARLEDPAIVRFVASSGSVAAPYLAMEWLDGEDLSARLARGRLPVAEALVLCERIAGALAAAHAIGVVHRDLKPANVFLPGRDVGAAKLLDFGVAWLAEGSFETEVGVVLGTVGYMAPEQARGLAGITPAVDLFALGVVLFEALAGRPPFVGEQPVAVLAKLLVEPTPRLSELGVEVPAALEELVDALLAKSPEARPPDAATVRRALAAIAADAPRAAPPQRGLGPIERRLSSVIFIAADAARAVTLSSAQFRRARELQAAIAARHGGSHEILRGGTALVALDAEGSLRAQAIRAARCALELRAATGDESVALATGRRSVGGPLSVGEVLDRCAALLRDAGDAEPKASSEPGARSAIRVDAATAALLRDDFEIGHDARGAFLGPPLPAVSAPSRAPIFGRDRELALLDATLEECVEERVARAVLILGPPGIGKSRLAREAIARASSAPLGAVEARPLEIWQAGADPASSGVPFAVLARAIGRAVGAHQVAPELGVARLRAFVERCGPSKAGARAIEIGLSILLGLPLPAGAEHLGTTRAALVRAAIEGWIEATLAPRSASAGDGARAALILALDDVQWCDLPTLRLVDGLLRTFAGAPLLLLATARPELAQSRPGLYADRGLTELRLGPLARAAAERLVRARLCGRLDDAPLESLLDRADGNPLFLDELARAIGEGRGGATPSTVASVIEARLRALDADQRRLLRAASVFGQRFPIAGARVLLGPDAREAPLVAQLDALVGEDVLVREGEGSAPAFAFAHALFAEAAYAMLTEDDRRLGHRLAADWLAGRGEAATTIARHWELADEPARAVDLYARAAEEALESGDASSAIVCADHGLRCGAQGEGRGALEAIAADANQHLGELVEARRRGQAALALLGPRSPHWHRASRAAIALHVSRVAL